MLVRVYVFAYPISVTLWCFTCIDIDECAEGLRTCDGGTFCRNTEGSSECIGDLHYSFTVLLLLQRMIKN